MRLVSLGKKSITSLVPAFNFRNGTAGKSVFLSQVIQWDSHSLAFEKPVVQKFQRSLVGDEAPVLL